MLIAKPHMSSLLLAHISNKNCSYGGVGINITYQVKYFKNGSNNKKKMYKMHPKNCKKHKYNWPQIQICIVYL